MIQVLIALLAGAAVAGMPAMPADAEQYLGGGPGAPIRLDVYSDFQCPTCRTLYIETIRPVLKEYSSQDKVSVVYHEFPLPGHPLSRQASRYALAAQKVGKEQWLAVVDSLYTHQDLWSKTGRLEPTIAAAVSPEDFARIRQMTGDPSVDAAIERDVAHAKKLKITSTPTFFVSALGREQKVVGHLPYPALKQYFDRIVK